MHWDVISTPLLFVSHLNGTTVHPTATEITGENAEALIPQEDTEKSQNTEADEQPNGAAAASSSKISGLTSFLSMSIVVYAMWHGPAV